MASASLNSTTSLVRATLQIAAKRLIKHVSPSLSFLGRRRKAPQLGQLFPPPR